MEKKFTSREIATIKRVAQNVNPMVTKKHKIEEKIAELQKEYNDINELQELSEAPIRMLTGGFGTEDIFEKVTELTDKVDKNGNSIKVTKYILKYPDTIIPVTNLEEVKPEEIDGEAKVEEIQQNPSDENSFDPTFGVEL